jgi:hypothetical protein
MRIGVIVSILVALGVLGVVALRVIPSARVRALNCAPTGFGSATAALVNPAGVVSGTIDATGCTFGIFYDASHSGNVSGAVLFGASSQGIVSQGGSLTVQNSAISRVGGEGVKVSGGSTVVISGNVIDHYGAGSAGILAALAATPSSSVVIARNKVSASSVTATGINVLDGATLWVANNVVTGNSDGIVARAPGSTELAVMGNVVTGSALGSGIVTLGPAVVKNNIVSAHLFGITASNTTTAPVDVARNSVRNGQVGIAVTSTSGQVVGNSVCVAPAGQPLSTVGSALTVSGNATSMSCP